MGSGHSRRRATQPDAGSSPSDIIESPSLMDDLDRFSMLPRDIQKMIFDRTHPEDVDTICKLNPTMEKLCSDNQIIENYLKYWNLEFPDISPANINKYEHYGKSLDLKGISKVDKIILGYIQMINSLKSEIFAKYLLNHFDWTNENVLDKNLLSFNRYQNFLIETLFMSTLSDETVLNILEKINITNQGVMLDIASYGSVYVGKNDRPLTFQWLFNKNLLLLDVFLENIIKVHDNGRLASMLRIFQLYTGFNELNLSTLVLAAINNNNFEAIQVLFELTKGYKNFDWVDILFFVRSLITGNDPQYTNLVNASNYIENLIKPSKPKKMKNKRL